MIQGIQCALCGKYMVAITSSHVKEHGLTLPQYRECYGPINPKEMREKLATMFPKEQVVDIVANSLDSTKWAHVLSEVGLRVFSEEARNATLNSAYILAQMRLSMFQKSAALMGRVLDEANKPWRTQLTDEGKPVTIRELQQLADIAQTDMKSSAEIIMKLTTSIVQDNKGVLGKEGQADRKAFSGEMDLSAIPGDLPPQLRDKMRSLIDQLDHIKRGLPAPQEVSADAGSKSESTDADDESSSD